MWRHQSPIETDSKVGAGVGDVETVVLVLVNGSAPTTTLQMWVGTKYIEDGKKLAHRAWADCSKGRLVRRTRGCWRRAGQWKSCVEIAETCAKDVLIMKLLG